MGAVGGGNTAIHWESLRDLVEERRPSGKAETSRQEIVQISGEALPSLW